MNQNKNIQVNETLIINYLAGEALPEEAIAIENWIKQPGNKDEFDRIIKAWNVLSTKAQFTYANPEEIWNSLQQKISYKSLGKKNFPGTRWLVAASILCLIIATFFIYNRNKESTLTTLITANNGITNKWLPDSSLISLAGKSSIKYNSSFNIKNRDVWLQGEAYFIVMPNKKNPFIIHDSDLIIQVVGTKFNVSNNKQKNEIKVQVHSGIVSLYNSGKKIFLNKGKTGIYNISEKNLTIENKVDDNSMSYATKNFNFNNTSLAEVAVLLEKAFNVKVVFKNKELQNCKITARFQNESLNYILQIISITLNISCTNANSIVLIDGKACD